MRILALNAAILLQGQIEDSIAVHGVVDAGDFGGSPGTKIYAYSTDGLGNYTVIDDANTPSLLSLPYFGFTGDPQIMQATREWVLSPSNPWYRAGPCARGVGSSHTPGDRIWPMALISQAITSSNADEISDSLRMLLDSDCTHAPVCSPACSPVCSAVLCCALNK